MFPKKIERPADVDLYDMITIIRDLGEKLDAARYCGYDLTLDNIETGGAGCITVISENPLGGAVYRYRNHGEYWEQIGTVCGYA